MSYERYKNYRLAPDDSGCWGVLNEEYESQGNYPSKAAAKRAIDDLSTPTDPGNDRELREQVGRFCRTEEAAENLIELINAHTEQKVREAEISEIKRSLNRGYFIPEMEIEAEGRIALLERQLNETKEEE